MFKQLTRRADIHRPLRSTLALWVLFCQPLGAEPKWRSLTAGVEYRPGWVENRPDQLVHLLRFEPARAQLRHIAGPRNSSQGFLAQSQALAVFNGGYFDDQDRPMGLLYCQQWIQPQAAGGSAFGGMFSITAGRPRLDPIFQLSEPDYQALLHHPRLDFMIQCGPRLLAGGRAVSGLEKTATRRTAIGFDQRGRVLLLASAPTCWLSFAQLQGYLSQQLKLNWALNLDGGSSTQCSIKGQVNCRGYSSIPFALGVFPR